MSSHTFNLKQKSDAWAPKCTSQATVSKWLSMTFHFTSMLRWSCLKQFSCSKSVSFFVHVQMTSWMLQVCSNVWKVSVESFKDGNRDNAALPSSNCTKTACMKCNNMYSWRMIEEWWLGKVTANLNLDMMKGRRWRRLRGITEFVATGLPPS